MARGRVTTLGLGNYPRHEAARSCCNPTGSLSPPNPIQGAAEWEAIASLVPGRNESQCRYRWSQDQEKQGTKLAWTPQEDELLRSVWEHNQGSSWAVIAEKLTSLNPTIKRSGKQCRERWRNHLNPDINKWLRDLRT